MLSQLKALNDAVVTPSQLPATAPATVVTPLTQLSGLADAADVEALTDVLAEIHALNSYRGKRPSARIAAPPEDSDGDSDGSDSDSACVVM